MRKPLPIARPHCCSYTLVMMTRHFLLLAGALTMISASANAQLIDPKVQARIDRILKATPLIDGHNDLAEQLRENYGMSIADLASGGDRRPDHPLMTDMARLRSEERRVGKEWGRRGVG